MTTNQEKNIETVVMRRVYTLHLLQIFLAPIALSLVFLVLALWGIGQEVWVAHVFHNMPPLVHFDAFVRFFEVAFTNTRTAVQLLVLAVIVSLVWSLYNISKLLKQGFQYARG